MSSTQPRSSAWLHGPALDLLFGCGGAYLLLLAVIMASGSTIRISQPAILFPVLTMLIGGPHYGATLLRVYEERKDRRAYALFSIWASAGVFALFLSSLWVASLGTFLITLYLSWSPWHYTGQNYGIAVTFLRRDGIELNPRDKRWLYWSFILSFVFAIIVTHMDYGAGAYLDPTSERAEAHFRPLGIPDAVTKFVLPAVLAAYAVVTGVAAWRLTRVASLRSLVPVGMIALSQMVWFVVPLALRWRDWAPGSDAFHPDLRAHYFVWIALAHAAQYLWVTSYFARKSGSLQTTGGWYLKTLACGSAIWMFPVLLFGPLGIGPLSKDLGLAILVASAVNVHHFILDGAIWKLRGHIADLLIRDVTDEPARSGANWGRRAVWILCSLGIGIYFFQIYWEDVERKAVQLEVRSASLDRLAWLGMDSMDKRMETGVAFLKRGNGTQAARQFQRVVDVTPRPEAWAFLGQSYLRAGEYHQALAAFERAREVLSDRPGIARGEARAHIALGQPREALSAIERAVLLAPDDVKLQRERNRVRKMVDALPTP